MRARATRPSCAQAASVSSFSRGAATSTRPSRSCVQRRRRGHESMSSRGNLLLINPKIAARRHARFPLSIMTIAVALEDGYDSTLIDGNLDAGAVRAACDAVRAQPFAAAGVTVMGGPQV